MLLEDSPYVSDIYMRAQDKIIINDNLQLMGTENCPFEVKDVLDRFATQVKQSLSDFESQYKSDPISKLYIVSPFSYIEGLVSELALRMPETELQLFSPFNDIIIPANIQPKVKAEQNPSIFTTTIGLATRKLDVFGYYKLVTGVKNVNLLPGRGALKKQKQQGLYRKLLIIPLVLIFIVGLVGYFYYTLGHINQLKDETANFSNIKAQHTEMTNIKNDLIKKQKKLQVDIEKGKKVISNQRESYDVLIEISKSVPKGVVLTKLIFQNNNEFTISGEAIKDSGIIKLIDNLNNSESVVKATLNTMGVKDGSESSKQVKVFNISLIINLEKTKNESEG